LFTREVSLQGPAPDQLVGVARECGKPPSSERHRLQLCALLVGDLERISLKDDLGLELEAPLATVTQADVLELALGGGEPLLGVCALLVELLALACEQTLGRIARRSGLLEGKRLDGGTREGAGCAFGRGRRIGFAQRRLAFDRPVGEVEAGFGSRARAGDVSPLAQGAAVVEEDVGTLDGSALGGVARERIGVVELLCGVVEREAAQQA
jgi:hypothetical protein